MARTGNRQIRLVVSNDGAGAESAETDYQSLETPIQVAVSRTARRFLLSPMEAEDLLSDVWVRLLSDRRVIERFRRMATLETYFSVIARNLVLDARNKTLGKWRPTAAAKRRGEIAIQLERMVLRDNMRPEVAVECLRSTQEVVTRRELSAIAQSIAHKSRRRTHVGVDHIARRPSPEPSPYDRVILLEAKRCTARVNSALADALGRLSQSERHLLRLRYADHHSVARIAEILSIPQKGLYRRFDSLLRRMRCSLQNAGVDRQVLTAVIGFDPQHLTALLTTSSVTDKAHEFRNSA
jgi:RNA polymerase sigma factor (sigma-70 family)